jgi:acetyl-CoA carboxylase biotin carboxyl carrier protein
MELDHDQLRELLAFLAESDIQELRLEGSDFRLEVRRNLPTVALPPPPPAPVPAEPASPPAVAAPGVSTAPPVPPPVTPATRSDLHAITAPMVGTFYRSSAPGEKPFVEVGGRVCVGQTLCILEAMKLMNEIDAEVSGEVVEILVENGTPVEFGQVLMRIRPG